MQRVSYVLFYFIYCYDTKIQIMEDALEKNGIFIVGNEFTADYTSVQQIRSDPINKQPA